MGLVKAMVVAEGSDGFFLVVPEVSCVGKV